MNYKIINGGITVPKGFTAAGSHVGIKKEKLDLALIKSEVSAAAAGCFTKNIVKAAPVVWDMKVCADRNKARGIIINSGNANACTGEAGMRDCEEMAAAYAACIGAKKEEIFVCSTGVIGVPLPIDKIKNGVGPAAKSMSIGGAENAARAIMTTDTFKKEIAVETELGGKTVKIAGIAKGSGMIHPDMATLLAFVTTDAAVSGGLLQKALTAAVNKTYNMISVDGDTSTNDTIIVLANGMAQNALISEENADYGVFAEALMFVCEKLAKDIARDGEGASKFMEVNVGGAASEHDAILLAKSVVSSSLVKAALFGADANYGRALCAMGYSGGKFDPDGVTISFRSRENDKVNFEVIKWMENGLPVSFDETAARKILERKDVFVDIELSGAQSGGFSARAWGCDLTYDYVKINGSYRS